MTNVSLSIWFKATWKSWLDKQYRHWFSEEIKLDLAATQSKFDLFQTEIDEIKVKLTESNAEIDRLNQLLVDDTDEAKCFGTISISEMAALLRPHCNDLRLSDGVYGLTSKDEAQRFCEKTKVSIKQYQSNVYDCDEFSFALMGYWNLDLMSFAFGIAWSKNHAFNIMIDNDHQIWCVEPQNNNFIKIEDLKSGIYYPMDVIMI